MSSLDNLRKEAKHWLREVRKHNPGHVKRLRLVYPAAPAEPALRDIQHALAREYGHESWAAMKSAVTHGATAPRRDDGRRDEPAAQFLELACWDGDVHGRGDYASRERAAMRLLETHPQVRHEDLYTAIVCGEVADVERIITSRPHLARVKGGARNWEPILYLSYGRLPLAPFAEHAVAMATLLLDRGADPNAYYMAGDALYGTLVGIAGEGEQDALPHPRRQALYALLLERGAELYDIQVLYNTHFRGDLQWWLELTYAQSVRLGREADWRNPEWPMLDMGGYGSGARFCLAMAIRHDDAALARWLLEHGADPNAPPPRSPAFPRRHLYDEALSSGCQEIAELLARHGATSAPLPPDDEHAFVVAAMQRDAATTRRILDAHPEYLRSPKAIFAAAQRDRVDVVAFLLDLGVPVDIEDDHKQRPLHIAAGSNALRVARLLIDRGAAIDTPETRWSAPPIGFAAYQNHQAMLDLLTPLSRCVPILAAQGQVERLREVLRSEPHQATAAAGHNATLLWWLPDVDTVAVEVVRILLEHGCDPAARAKDGTTAADRARHRGLDAAAALIDAAAADREGPRHIEQPRS